MQNSHVCHAIFAWISGLVFVGKFPAVMLKLQVGYAFFGACFSSIRSRNLLGYMGRGIETRRNFSMLNLAELDFLDRLVMTRGLFVILTALSRICLLKADQERVSYASGETSATRAWRE